MLLCSSRTDSPLENSLYFSHHKPLTGEISEGTSIYKRFENYTKPITAIFTVKSCKRIRWKHQSYHCYFYSEVM